MSRWAAGAMMASVNTSTSTHGNALHSPITTPPVLWTGGPGNQIKVEPAVNPSSGVVHVPPPAAAMLWPYGFPVTWPK